MADTIYWIDADGISTNLTNGVDLFVLGDCTGLDGPIFDFVTDEYPLSDGMQLREVRTTEREIQLHMLIRCDSRKALRQKISALSGSMNPKRGYGKLRFVTESSQREIYCLYSNGLNENDNGLAWREVVLVFNSYQPYWQSVNPKTSSFLPGVTTPFFPIFPLALVQSRIFSSGSLLNAGNVKSWPIWTISGPCDSARIINLDYEHELEIMLSLGEEEVIVIDTRPGKKSAKKNDGSNQYSSLSEASYLWPLEPGGNLIEISLSNSTTSSRVDLQYTENFLTPTP